MCACVPACLSLGTSIGTPKPVRAHLGSTASAVSGGGYSSNFRETSHVRSASGSVADGGPMLTPASVQSYHYEGQGGAGSSSTADYDLATGMTLTITCLLHCAMSKHALLFFSFFFLFFQFLFFLSHKLAVVISSTSPNVF